MIITYNEQYLEDLYETGKCKDKKHRFQQSVIQKYQRRIDTLMAATRIEDLFVFNSLNFESIDQRNNKFSIRIDYHYRLVFEIRYEGTEPKVVVCNVLEISNHYQ
ncbi:MAG: type II toxin-antitoxin system RelE/ParE family toxin [Bacteroidaceae bacterium]|nr:type II toxin-antitoxin system RelE/ParE family toxin [Candidatus Minthousia equi]MCQ2245292.1 type II toxin-antitoxin system RelE/ParE family toxin [Bacteroidaceae bacterium]